MLMLQRDASAAVLSQRTFDLAKLLVTRRKKKTKKLLLTECLTFVMTRTQ